jgi:hypothetical protein
MMVKNKIIGTVVACVCCLSVSGCSIVKEEIRTIIKYSNEDYTNKEEAEKFVLSTLKEKYNKEFEIVESEYGYYKDRGVKRYQGPCCEKAHPEKAFSVVATSVGEFNDNYPLAFFEDELLKMGDELLFGDPMIEQYSVNLKGGFTSENNVYTPKDSAITYFKTCVGRAGIVVLLQSGYSDEEYAKEIKLLYDELYEIYGDIWLHVAESQQYIFQDEKPKRGEETITAEGKIVVAPGYDLTEADVLASVKYYRENPTKIRAGGIEDNRKK